MNNMRKRFIISIALVWLGHAYAQNCYKWVDTATGGRILTPATCAPSITTDQVTEPCYRLDESPHSSKAHLRTTRLTGFQTPKPPSQTTQVRRWSPQEGVAYFGGKGEKSSFNFPNIDVLSMLQVLADASNTTIILDGQAKSDFIEIKMVDKTWVETLLFVLHVKNLAVIKVRSGFYVFPSSLPDKIAIQRASEKGL